MVDAIVKSGIDSPLQARLQEIAAEKRDLEAALEATPDKLDGLPDVVPRALQCIRDKILNLDALLDVRKATPRRVAEARTPYAAC